MRGGMTGHGTGAARPRLWGPPTPPRCGEPHVVSFATWTSPSTAGRTRTRCGRATPPRARAAVDGALAAGVAVPDVYLGILQPALYAVGHEWAAGELDIAREHYATAVTLTVLGALGPRMRAAPKDGRLAVVSGSPEERHAVGVQMVADFLEGDGWEVLNLGASTPARDLARLVDAEQPDVVALSASTPGRPPRHGRGGGGAARAAPAPARRARRPAVGRRGPPRGRGAGRRPRARRPAGARRPPARALSRRWGPTKRSAASLVSVRRSRRVIPFVVFVAALVVVALLLHREDQGLPGNLPGVPTPPGAKSDRERTPLPDPFAYDPSRKAEFERRAAAGTSHVLYARSPGGAGITAPAGRALAAAGRGGGQAGGRRPRPARGARLPRERRARGRDGGRHRGRRRADPDPRRDRPEPARHARRRGEAAAATPAASAASWCAGIC